MELQWVKSVYNWEGDIKEGREEIAKNEQCFEDGEDDFSVEKNTTELKWLRKLGWWIENNSEALQLWL